MITFMKYGILFLLIITGCSNSEIQKPETVNAENSRIKDNLAFTGLSSGWDMGHSEDLRKSIEGEIQRFFVEKYPNSKIKGFSYREYKGFLIYWCDLEDEKVKIVIVQRFYSKENKLYFKILEVGESKLVDFMTNDVSSKEFNKIN